MRVLSIVLLCLFAVGFSAQGADELPLPRFATIKSGQANIRNGPGTQYPIQWVLVRKNTPVEIVAEYENWRKVRDIDGDEGWIHRGMLSGERTVSVVHGQHTLYHEASANSPPVAYVEEGVNAKLLECNEGWCRVRVETKGLGQAGWIERTHIWGIYPEEKEIK